MSKSLVSNQSPMLQIHNPSIGALLLNAPALTQPWPLVRFSDRPVG